MSEPVLMAPRPAARSIAEKLVARALPKAPTPDTAAEVAELIFAQVHQNLSQWVGSKGSEELFARALRYAAANHLVFAGVQYRPAADPPRFHRLAENARESGGQAAAEGVTAALAWIIETLTVLIGDEQIAMSLLGTAGGSARL